MKTLKRILILILVGSALAGTLSAISQPGGLKAAAFLREFTGTFSGFFGGFLFIVLPILIYFAPYLVARFRHHTNVTAILVINLFLGWTILGWVGALVWAVSKRPPSS